MTGPGRRFQPGAIVAAIVAVMLAALALAAVVVAYIYAVRAGR